ncbi:MAG: pilus assembly protein TadG-related protein, partial [Sulfuriferula sp.]
MTRPVSFSRSWPDSKGRRYQQGQALIYGIVVMMGGLAALFFLFNTGQLTREKTKLVNTADAVAYSAGVMNARALNFEAYTNRAMLANTVAIAQLVSLSSWVQYTNNLATYGSVVANPKFVAFYPSYYGALYSGNYLQQNLIDNDALKDLAEASDTIIQKVLMNAQQVAYAGLIPARQKVMDDVAQANYHNDGVIIVDAVPLTVNEFTRFVTRYSGDDRTRFAEVAKISANLDGFVPKRSWLMPGLWSDCGGATASGRVDFLTRRGGTELLGFDEWKAMDTLSEKRWVPKNKTDVLCQALAETPAGWGLQAALPQNNSDTPDLDPTHYDYSFPINPSSSGLAMVMSSTTWNYSGIPS